MKVYCKGACCLKNEVAYSIHVTNQKGNNFHLFIIYPMKSSMNAPHSFKCPLIKCKQQIPNFLPSALSYMIDSLHSPTAN